MQTNIIFPAPYYAPDAADTADIAALQAGTAAGVSRCVENVVPMTNGYASMAQAEQFAPPPAGDRLHSLYCHYYADTDYDIFAGSEKALYIWDKRRLIWVKCGTYNAPERLSFASYRDICLCANAAGPVLYFDRAKGGFVPLENKDETVYQDAYGHDIAADKVPYADYCFVCDNFLVLVKGNRLMWSAPDRIDFWTMGQNGCGDVYLPQGGAIRYVSPEYSPFILCDRAIYRLSRVNGDVSPFSLVKISTERGCPKPFGAATVDSTTYFIDREGFYAISADNGLERIGYNQVDHAFRAAIHDRINPVSVAANAYNNRVLFLFRAYGLYYDYALQRWTKFSRGGASAVLIPRANKVLEQAEAEPLPLAGTRPRSFDDKAYLHGAYAMAQISPAGAVEWQAGEKTEPAIIETGIFGFGDGRLFHIDDIYAVSDYEAAHLRCRIYWTETREPNEDKFHYADLRPNPFDGKFIARKRARWARLRFYLDAAQGWRKFQAVRAAIRPAGFI